MSTNIFQNGARHRIPEEIDRACTEPGMSFGFVFQWLEWLATRDSCVMPVVITSVLLVLGNAFEECCWMEEQDGYKEAPILIELGAPLERRTRRSKFETRSSFWRFFEKMLNIDKFGMGMNKGGKGRA